MKLTAIGMCGAIALILVATAFTADQGPQPRVVTAGAAPAEPPSDAIVLFDGRDLSHWARRDGSPARSR